MGKSTTKIDAALHLGRSAELYHQLTGKEAAIVAHLQTSKTFLNEYLHKIKATKTVACKCSVVELIAYFLFSCRR